jgi:hypothetical protein
MRIGGGGGKRRDELSIPLIDYGLCNSSGSLAMLAAIRRASSRLARCLAERHWCVLSIVLKNIAVRQNARLLLTAAGLDT